MPFDTTIAYGIALLIAVVLGFMGVRNQRSEWRRERSDTVLDIVMAWAEAKAGMLTTATAHANGVAPRQAGTTRHAAGGELAALHFALSVETEANDALPSVNELDSING